MKKILLTIILISLLLISGCSSMGSASMGGLFGSKSKTPEIDRTGQGLLVNFNLKTELISTRQLNAELTLENTGVEQVILKKENVKLYTTISGEEVFEKTSLDNFYKTIFQNKDELTIYHDQKTPVISSPIFINNDFFTKKTRENFEYIFEIKYDYKTSFSNNLEIDLKNAKPLKTLDSPSQAAPVQITKIELEPILNGGYAIKYYLNDKGQTSQDFRTIKIKNIKIQFRTEELGSNCKGITYKDNIYKDVGLESLTISKETPEVIIACKVNLEDIDKTNKMITTTSGSFEYEYNIKTKNTITLPQKSGDQIIWQ